jgi:PAS domain S-box-containing protein
MVMELSILNNLESFKAIFNAINDAVFIHDGETGELIAVNLTMCEMYGYTEEEALNLDIEDLSYGETPYTQLNALEMLAKTTFAVPQRFEWLAKKKSGDLFWVEVNTKKTRIDDEDYYVVIVRDIDDHKKTIENLCLSEEKFSAAFHTAADMVSISRVDNSVFVDVNQSVLEVLGYPPEELIGKSALALGIWPIKSERESLTSKLSEEGYFRDEEVHLQRKDGKIINTSISANLIPIKGELFVFSNVRDISERIEAKREIEKLNKELEQRIMLRTAQLESANRELEAFSYSVSHDLRAPLRAIKGFSQILIEECDDLSCDESREYLDRIFNSTDKMDRLVTGLLDLSRLDRQELSPEVVQLDELSMQIFNELIEKEEARAIEFSAEEYLKVTGDPVLLRVLLTNLISNAIKYSKHQTQNSIALGAKKSERGLVYFVRDNGIGFDPSFSARIFEPFQRLHGEDEYEGVGIGLAIAKRIVRHHNGRIWVESKEGAGTTFYFTLNVNRGSAV